MSPCNTEGKQQPVLYRVDNKVSHPPNNTNGKEGGKELCARYKCLGITSGNSERGKKSTQTNEIGLNQKKKKKIILKVVGKAYQNQE